jgi:putative nucleotidyltransferase with HDIG domain
MSEIRELLTARRRDLIERIVRSTSTGNRTLKLDLLASRFVEQFAATVESGDAGEVARWFAGDARLSAQNEQLRGIVSAGCRAVVALVESSGALPETVRRELYEARRKIEHAAGTSSPIACAELPSPSSEKDRAIAEIVAGLERSDRETVEHSRAVAAWCARLCRTLGLSDDQTEFVTECGLLHDIGKTATPHGLLYKPGRLTEEEWSVIRSHPAIAAQMLEHVPALRHYTQHVRAHRERMDSRGYPDGLAGADIPIAARIVAVADAFHAMVTEHPYRGAMTPNAALAELVRCRAQQFDADVVEAMLKIFGVGARDLRQGSRKRGLSERRA